eukprot:5610321-Lingulodinium_polyedra.AAC.1
MRGSSRGGQVGIFPGLARSGRRASPFPQRAKAKWANLKKLLCCQAFPDRRGAVHPGCAGGAPGRPVQNC